MQISSSKKGAKTAKYDTLVGNKFLNALLCRKYKPITTDADESSDSDTDPSNVKMVASTSVFAKSDKSKADGAAPAAANADDDDDDSGADVAGPSAPGAKKPKQHHSKAPKPKRPPRIVSLNSRITEIY